MKETVPAARRITGFLELLRSAGGFLFEYTLEEQPSAASLESKPNDAQPPSLVVRFTGLDTPLLLDRNGELLHALESLAVDILRLPPEQADTVSFDAEDFKARRDQAIAVAAASAVDEVRATGRPFAFSPMTSRERRLLHLALLPSGLATASSGLGPRRFVVVYPEGQTPPSEPAPRSPARPFSTSSRFRQVGQPDRHPARRGPGGLQNSRESLSRPNTAGPVLPPAATRPTSPDPLGDEANGNRATPGVPPSPTDARQESIRRAFRKR